LSIQTDDDETDAAERGRNSTGTDSNSPRLGGEVKGENDTTGGIEEEEETTLATAGAFASKRRTAARSFGVNAVSVDSNNDMTDSIGRRLREGSDDIVTKKRWDSINGDKKRKDKPRINNDKKTKWLILGWEKLKVIFSRERRD
jgi:hypothetical protein